METFATAEGNLEWVVKQGDYEYLTLWSNAAAEGCSLSHCPSFCNSSQGLWTPESRRSCDWMVWTHWDNRLNLSSTRCGWRLLLLMTHAFVLSQVSASSFELPPVCSVVDTGSQLHPALENCLGPLVSASSSNSGKESLPSGGPKPVTDCFGYTKPLLRVGQVSGAVSAGCLVCVYVQYFSWNHFFIFVYILYISLFFVYKYLHTYFWGVNHCRWWLQPWN